MACVIADQRYAAFLSALSALCREHELIIDSDDAMWVQGDLTPQALAGAYRVVDTIVIDGLEQARIEWRIS